MESVGGELCLLVQCGDLWECAWSVEGLQLMLWQMALPVCYLGEMA